MGDTKIRKTRTTKRLSLPTKMSFVGCNGTWWRKRKEEKRLKGSFAAHQANCLTNNSREGMNKLDYWTEAIDEFAIFVAVFFEGFHILFEEPKDGTWRVTALYLLSKRVIF